MLTRRLIYSGRLSIEWFELVSYAWALNDRMDWDVIRVVLASVWMKFLRASLLCVTVNVRVLRKKLLVFRALMVCIEGILTTFGSTTLEAAFAVLGAVVGLTVK